ncbi:MAG: hypothetical protein SWH78_17650 [Thermodesulfobacteriota bacterium]|nr:hypothetical protein [Thermodesulfobacteriota bacterium]
MADEKEKERLDAIAKEEKEHDEALKRIAEETVKIKNGLLLLKKDQQKKVEGILEETFAHGGDRKALDLILKTEMKTPKIQQAQDTMAKLEAKGIWHRNQKAKLALERRGILEDLRIREKVRLCKQVHSSFRQLTASYEEAEKHLEPLLEGRNQLINLCSGERPGWTQELINNKVPSWMVTLMDSYLSNMDTATLSDFVFLCAGCHSEGNPFYNPKPPKRTFPQTQ